MHHSRGAGIVLATAIVLAGCYNARVITGLTPSDQVIQEDWAASWIYGAVSPKTVEAAAQCPNGVAQVHTYHSFLNILVASLTAGIFTPISIQVTCAAGSRSRAVGATDMRIDTDAPLAQQLAQFQQAVDRSRRTGERVLVRF
jgi:hypothetical protein